MPTRILSAFVEHQPRVQAERAMAMAEQVAVGMGRMRESDHRASVSRWRAAMATGPRRRPTIAELGTAARSAGVGFRVVHVERPT